MLSNNTDFTNIGDSDRNYTQAGGSMVNEETVHCGTVEGLCKDLSQTYVSDRKYSIGGWRMLDPTDLQLVHYDVLCDDKQADFWFLDHEIDCVDGVVVCRKRSDSDQSALINKVFTTSNAEEIDNDWIVFQNKKRVRYRNKSEYMPYTAYHSITHPDVQMHYELQERVKVHNPSGKRWNFKEAKRVRFRKRSDPPGNIMPHSRDEDSIDLDDWDAQIARDAKKDNKEFKRRPKSKKKKQKQDDESEEEEVSPPPRFISNPKYEDLFDEAPSLAPSDEFSLSGIVSMLPSDVSQSDDPNFKEWVNYAENVTLLAYHLVRAETFMDFCVAILSFIKMHTNQSLILTVKDIVFDLMRVETEVSGIQPQSLDMVSILSKWEAVKTSSIFRTIGFLISAALALPICSLKKIEFNPLGFTLVKIEALKEQCKAVDLLDAIIKSFAWLSEVGYQILMTGSLDPLLYTNVSMKQYNDLCDKVLADGPRCIAGNGDIFEYEQQLDEAIKQTTIYKRTKNDLPTVQWLQSRFVKLCDLKEKVVSKHRNTGMRMAPIGWAIVGTTGAGKTSIAKLTMKCSLESMGYKHDPSRIITKDMFDKYDSTYTSDIIGVYMDDVGNGKPEHVEVSPTDVIIKFFNNVNAQAVKADIVDKGNVFINFKCGVLTSNIKDLGARHYSDCPESILRRFYHVRVSVKEEYRKPGSLCLDSGHPDLRGSELAVDVWNLDILECRPYERNGTTSYTFEPLVVEIERGVHILTTGMNISEYLRVVVILSQKHKREQDNVLRLAKLADDFPSCSLCCLPRNICNCEMKPHSLDDISNPFERIMYRSITQGFNGFIRKQFWWLTPVCWYKKIFGINPVEKMVTSAIAKEISSCINYNALPVCALFCPDYVLSSRLFQKAIAFWSKSAAMHDFTSHFRWGNRFLLGSWLFLGYNILGGKYSTEDSIFKSACLFQGTLAYSAVSYTYYSARIRHYNIEYAKRRDAFSPETKKKCVKLASGALVITSILLSLRLFRAWHLEKTKPQARDVDKSSWTEWLGDKMGMRLTSKKGNVSSSNDVVQSLIKSNLYVASFERDFGITTWCNIFFPRKNVALFPAHIWYQEGDSSNPVSSYIDVTVYRSAKPGGVFSFKVDSSSCVFVKAGDMCMAYVPNCPDLRDKSGWFPELLNKGSTLANFLSVDRVGNDLNFSVERITAIVDTGRTGHNHAKFFGGHYICSRVRSGACMSPIITDAKEPVILGFHMGGCTNTKKGVFHTLTRNEYDTLINDLSELPGVILSTGGSELPLCQYKKEILASDVVHPHSMAATLDNSAFVELYGSTRLRTVQKTTVSKSVISDSVADIMGCENHWSGPQLMPNWKAYNASLEHMIRPPKQFLPAQVERARKDWLKPLLVLAQGYKASPLTFKEAIMGVPGKRFLESLPMSTGMGFPVFGPKKRHFEDVWENGVLVDRLPSDLVKEECVRLLSAWQRGERAYPIFSATLKDEPTPIGSSKVRVFQASPVALSIYIRKYFLPIARFLATYPIESECAVGLNSFSPDWEELMDYATTNVGNHGMLAWDYSKYDIRMSSQITRAVLISYIEIAQQLGYEKCDIDIMKAMINDIVHPLIDYNGVLLMAFNMNTSGNSITVNINSTAGSIYVRLGFWRVYPNVSDFRSAVCCMTYGDDFIGSIKQEYKGFNYKSYKEFLAEHDMKITLPIKSADDSGIEFLPYEEVDFLKRKSQFIPEISHCIGKLDEMSIFKSLHANLESKTQTKREVAVSCIESAMHEWFAYGRDHYELRRAQLKQVCGRHNLFIPVLDYTFDHRVGLWKEKYDQG